jgi:hypothetical protein
MIGIAKLHSNTNGKSHTVRRVISIIMSIVIEMLFAMRFASQRVISLLKPVL